MQQLRDRVAVVTGGASGVGRALAKAFLGEGMKVVLADVEEPALKATAEALSADGEISSFVTDVRRFEALEALADHTWSTFGACHLLCNNAGVSVAQLNVWETTPNDWTWVHGVNVHGVIHGIQAFVPRMIEEGHEGLVMNTSSGDGGVQPLATQSVYASSKSAIMDPKMTPTVVSTAARKIRLTTISCSSKGSPLSGSTSRKRRFTNAMPSISEIIRPQTRMSFLSKRRCSLLRNMKATATPMIATAYQRMSSPAKPQK